MNEVVTIVVNNLLEIVFAVLGASFTALVIPWLKDTGLPWLKEKRLYSIVKKFVEAAEKQAEVTASLRRALATGRGDRAALLDAVNEALYAAAAAVETPGGQSIVALLAQVPKALG